MSITSARSLVGTSHRARDRRWLLAAPTHRSARRPLRQSCTDRPFRETSPYRLRLVSFTGQVRKRVRSPGVGDADPGAVERASVEALPRRGCLRARPRPCTSRQGPDKRRTRPKADASSWGYEAKRMAVAQNRHGLPLPRTFHAPNPRQPSIPLSRPFAAVIVESIECRDARPRDAFYSNERPQRRRVETALSTGEAAFSGHLLGRRPGSARARQGGP